MTIMSLRDDFREFDEQGQYSDTSSDSEDGESNSDSDSDNDNEETMRSKEENRKRLEDLFSPQMDDKRFFSQSKSLSMGSGIFSDDGSQSGKVICLNVAQLFFITDTCAVYCRFREKR